MSSMLDEQFRAGMALLADRDAPERYPEALALIESAAAAGHADALERRAVLESVGVTGSADWGKALDTLAEAAGRGSQVAARQLILLAQDRFDAAADPVTAKDLRSRIDIARRLRPMSNSGQLLSSSPFVRAIHGFCTPAECQWLIAAAAPRLERATVYGSGVNQGRTNRSAVLDLAHTDVVTQMIRTRICNELGAPLGCLEVPQVLGYEVGEEFVLHCDFLDPRTLGDEIARHGQRTATFLIYLNDDFDGGETSFPALGIKHRGRTGDALIFGNLGANRMPDPRSQHAGLPPTRGVKWVFSQWIRDRSAS